MRIYIKKIKMRTVFFTRLCRILDRLGLGPDSQCLVSAGSVGR